MERVGKECVYCSIWHFYIKYNVEIHHKLWNGCNVGPFPMKNVHVHVCIVVPFHSVVPMDLDVKMKAVMLGATFLIVS